MATKHRSIGMGYFGRRSFPFGARPFFRGELLVPWRVFQIGLSTVDGQNLVVSARWASADFVPTAPHC